ncbi:MAG TPA: DnaB-like helicase N-terminal domain-containing protein, partial [Acidimicrobiia bacterium]
MTYTPPHDLDAEQITLAGCMERPGLAAYALEQLTADVFYRDAHRTVFEAIRSLADRERPTDLTSVTALLQDAGTLDDVGGPVALFDLSNRFLSSAHHRSAVRTVGDMASRRSAIEQMRRAVIAFSGQDDYATTVDRTVDALIRTLPAGEVADPTDVSLEFYERIQGATVQAFRSGIRDLDSLITLPKGMLTILTGLPGSGKSTFLDWLIMQYAEKADARPVFFSPEQGPPARHLVGLVHTRLGFDPVGSDRRDDIDEARQWWMERVSWIQDDRDNSASAVLAIARTRASKGGNLLVIDPYNNMTPDQKHDRQDLYIQDLLRKVKRFARDTNMAVVIVAHPKSVPLVAGTDSVFRVPTAGDISGGQEWWNHADVIATVWRNQSGERPETYGDPKQVELVVQKVRDVGRVGRLG